jgi:hypothetical protein
LAVSYLHSQGIAHRGTIYDVSFSQLSDQHILVDLHIDNFGCSLPGLDELGDSDLIDHFGDPDCVPILAVNPMDQTSALPPYIVSAISMADYLAKATPPLPIEARPPSLKLLDFGSGTLPLIIARRYGVTWLLKHFGREKPDPLHNARFKYGLLRLYFP